MKFQISVILIFTSIINTSLSQNITIKKLDILDQLPSNSVERIFQDKEGYTWIGSKEGLCRYDGYRVKTFRSDIHNPELLSNNHITSIEEAASEKIIIGTQRGLNILDKKTYHITPFPDSTLFDKSIKALLYDSDSSLWVSYNNGLNRYDKNNKLFTKYMSPGNRYKLPTGAANIFKDSYNNVWITVWGKGLFKFNRNLNNFIKYPQIGKSDNPFCLYQDNKNNYWIGTWREGLYQFFPNSNLENPYKKIPLPTWMNKYYNTAFYSIIQDNNLNYLWVMTLNGIITYKYNENGNIEPIDTREIFKSSNNIFSEIKKDNKGDLWIASFSEGISKISFKYPLINNFPLTKLEDNGNVSPSFISLCEDNDKDIWIKQNRESCYIYSEKYDQIKNLTEYPELSLIPDFTFINYVTYISSLKEIWACSSTNPVIYKIKKNNHKITKVTSARIDQEQDFNVFVTSIYEDHNANIWIGSRNSIYLQPSGSDKIKLVKKNIGNISSISVDIYNNLWVSTNNNGCFRLELPNKLNDFTAKELNARFKQYNLFGNKINSLTTDYSGNLWLANEEGHLIIYNIINKTHSYETSNCGLEGETILDLIVDQFNQLWIITYKNVIKYNPDNKASYSYNIHNGFLVNSHYKGAYYLSKESGKIIFGGNKGYSYIYPSNELKQETEQTETIISDIKIHHKSILGSEIAEKFNSQSKTLTLSPHDKNIELYFSTLNYNNPQKIRYAYKLEGVDNNWVELKSDRQFAIYSELKKGEYLFRVKSTDIYNIWRNKETQLTIIKKPAYYETRLAFFLYFIILTGSMALLIYIIKSRITFRNKMNISELEKKKTDELTQTKLKYFTNISHDLLTPLTIISCIIDDIEISDKPQKFQLSTMRSNIVRLKRLLQQILDFKRVENGKMQLHISNTDISSFIKNICYSHFVPLFEKKHINFNLNSLSNEIDAYFDADKIDKVIFNLLSNALKFTPEHGSISVKLDTIEQNNIELLKIEISDTGIGIPPQDIKNIFTRFYTNRKMNASDTHGIGLSLCKDLIEIHHGSISVKSTVNKGTTFNITIPINKGSYSPAERSTESIIEIQETASITEFNENESPQHTNDINILIVEDNMELLLVMKNILSKTYNVYTAINGIEALEITKTNEIHIMISDVMMPEMDGLELCKTIKNNIESSHISVILLTAKNSTQDRIECYNAGADAYISKPFESNILLARINNFIKQKQNKQKEFKDNLEINISSLENHELDKQFLKNAVDIIEKKLSVIDFDNNMFAKELNMSKSSLYRKIKTLTGLSPIEFARNIKLKHACILLKNNTASITDVAYAVGFSDPKYFSTCFKNEFNMTPSLFQKENL
ncbi:ATP-binding protein [Plebeiibacterium marinum]|uniref:histidine kinase n=1 Tax=Plebeiibacterium marinum TaxID=2992111 RepID=A0AAE3MDB0_9BACT|nr:ATP-binding protein [Plebeiobacterium marinum]MCW3805500.1 ATP-binding protein [Plebeiobacterium marinum]